MGRRVNRPNKHMAKATPEAVKSAPQVSLPPGLDENAKAELLKFLSMEVHAEWHGGDPRLNRRAIVRVTSNYPTYTGQSDNSIYHEAAPGCRPHQFPVGRWCALPLAVIEQIAWRQDDYETWDEEIPQGRQQGISNFAPVKRFGRFKMRPKFQVEVWDDPITDGDATWTPQNGFRTPAELEKILKRAG